MPPHQFLASILTESVYTLVISVLCFAIFMKTKEISDISRYRGIQFFRYSFLFFGIAYLSRLLLIAFAFQVSRRVIMPLSMLITAYFSTMALMALAYSTIWKKIPEHSFWVSSQIIAIVLLAVILVFQNMQLMLLIQLGLFLIAIVIVEASKRKKFSKMRMVYLLLFLFWLVNLLIIGHRGQVNLGLRISLQVVSVLIFLFVYFRVTNKIK